METYDQAKHRRARVTASALAGIALLFHSAAEAGTWISLDDFWLYASQSGSQGDEAVRVAMDTVMSNPDQCTVLDGYIMSTNLSTDAQKRIYSILLAAQIAQRPVYVMVNGCQQNRPAIVNAALRP